MDWNLCSPLLASAFVLSSAIKNSVEAENRKWLSQGRATSSMTCCATLHRVSQRGEPLTLFLILADGFMLYLPQAPPRRA